MLNDPEWYALCSRRIGCSVPLKEYCSNHLQLLTERRDNQVVVLVASLAFGSEALSWSCSIGSFQLGLGFEFWAKETLGYDPSSRVGACGRRPSESADPGASASWAVYRSWYRVHCRKKALRGAGAGAC